MNTEQRVIEILEKVNDLAADAGDAFYDIAGEDLKDWDEIRVLIRSIQATLDNILQSHEEERRYRGE
jgi:uncharacterized membrane protein